MGQVTSVQKVIKVAEDGENKILKLYRVSMYAVCCDTVCCVHNCIYVLIYVYTHFSITHGFVQKPPTFVHPY